MSRYSRKNRFIPILLIVVIMIIAVVALVSLARAIFFSGGSERNQTVQVREVNRQALLEVKGSSRVEMTVRGPIVADEEFNTVTVSVAPNSRQMVAYRGYLDGEIGKINLGNNSKAYSEFVHALDKANLAAGKPFEGEKDDTSGICATGRVYEYNIYDGDNRQMRLWTSTCKGSPGSLRASSSQLSDLFIAQIPDAKELLRKVDY